MDQRYRRWTNIITPLVQNLMFHGNSVASENEGLTILKLSLILRDNSEDFVTLIIQFS